MKLEVKLTEIPVDDHLIKGHLILTRKSNKKPNLKSLSIIVHGKGSVAFTNQYGVMHRRKKIFHSVTVPLLGKYDEFNFELMDDKWGMVIPFQVQLPYNLPCSYSGSFGGIKYTVSGEGIQMGPLSRKCVSEQNTVELVPMCMPASTRSPQSHRAKKSEWLALHTTKVRLNVEVDQGTTFTPGVPLQLTLSLTNANESAKTFTVCIMLLQNITWVAGSMHRQQARIIDQTLWSVTLDPREKSQDNVILKVDDSLPREQSNEFYTIEYKLQANAALFSMPGSCNLYIPLQVAM